MMLYLRQFTLFVLLALVAAQCQGLGAGPTPIPAPPTIVLVPPIQRGDGTDLIDRLLDTGVVRVGVRVWPGPEFSPPVFRDVTTAESGGALTGFEVDITRAVAEGLGLELELIEADPRLLNSGDWQGRWDLAIASLVPFDQPLEPSAQAMVYSTPYGYMPVGLLIAANDENIKGLADLSTRRVGAMEHTAYQRLLTPVEGTLTVQGQVLMPKPPADLQLIVLSNMAKAIRQFGEAAPINQPQAEAILGPVPMFQEAIVSGAPVKLAPEANQVGLQPLAIAAVPQEGLKVERLMAEINNVLERLQRQGTLTEIYLKWYGQDLSRVEGN
jgi:L-cystine transport system substrate-binding protein